MIGKLQGIVDYIGDDYVIIMAGGVGYKVYTATNLCIGDMTTLWIETIVREDSFRLFGFESIAGQDLFNKLIGVSGVGPKVAISILGAFRPEILMTAIQCGDAKTITAAPGVGKKVAEKIIVELKSKCADFKIQGADGGINNALGDLLAALESLGYRRTDVAELSQKLIRENPALDVGALVRLALKGICK
ncbi:MAG: Holliday junction branch migration protein RuvA [Alphaproteobacteria bacterium]